LPWILQMALAEREPVAVLERWGRPLDALVENWAAVKQFLLGVAEEAREPSRSGRAGWAAGGLYRAKENEKESRLKDPLTDPDDGG